MNTETDTHLITDVSISLLSYREFYEAGRALRLNYSRKVAADKFDRMLAIKGLTRLVTDFVRSPIFAQLYCADIRLSPTERIAIACNVLDHWEDEIFAR